MVCEITTDKGKYTAPVKEFVRIAPGGTDIIFAVAKDAQGTVQKASLHEVYFGSNGPMNGEGKKFQFDVVL